jgi:hypothetical protein
MKKIIYLLIFLLCIVFVYAECEPKESIYDRLFDTCKADDGICNDGEWGYVDKDCKIDNKSILCKDDTCIYHMVWFIRILIIALLLLLLCGQNKYIKYKNIYVLIILFLLLLSVSTSITRKSPVKVQYTQEQLNDNFFYKWGHSIWPSHPYIGFFSAAIVIFLLLNHLLDNMLLKIGGNR